MHGRWYTSTDPKLLHWTLADPKFAAVIDANGKETGAAIAGIGAPMFYPIPNAPPEMSHMITSDQGEVWAVGHYDPETEKMLVHENMTQVRVVEGVNFLFTTTGQATDENRLLQAGWLWSGSWQGSNTSDCWENNCGILGTGFSLVRDVRWDSTANQLIAPPVPEYSKLHGTRLVSEAAKELKAGELWTLHIAGSQGSAVELRLTVPVLTATATSVSVAALAPPTTTSGALQVSLNVSSAPFANGSRAASLSVRNEFAPPHRNQTTTSVSPFLVLPAEHTVSLQIFIDRVVVEAFAMGGKAAVIANEFSPDPQSTIHVYAEGGATVRNVSVWSMGCGYAPL